ncbi:MAG: class I SAM-dependent methyltransferase [Phycisphaerae bacterium]
MWRDLRAILACPDCKGAIETRAGVVTASGLLKSAVILCPRCDRIVAHLRNFQFDFLRFHEAELRQRLLQAGGQAGPIVELPWDVSEETLSRSDPRLEWLGNWQDWQDGSRMTEGLAGDRLRFRGEFLDVGCRLLRHPWSGRVRFLIDGQDVGGTDLFHPDQSVAGWFPIAYDLPAGEHSVEIVATGQSHPSSHGCQVFFHELVLTRPDPRKGARQRANDQNRVLPIFPSVIDLIQEVPQDGWILDCGGGDRRLADERYVNVDLDLCQLPTVIADATKLPFLSDSFHFVFSQALLEHVPDPFAAVREMVRVTRPGGKIWAGMAFLQPVHAVPGHYFNATAWGIEQLFRGLEILSTSWFGELSFTIDWLLRASGAAAKIGPERVREILDLVKPLDSVISYEELRNVASGVAVLARKAP